MYYENLSNVYGWLESQPTKRGALENANIKGAAEILPNSNNRALIIKTDKAVYLQSYDTTILKLENNKLVKFWNNYSKTTMKHINTFLTLFKLPALNKKDWLAL